MLSSQASVHLFNTAKCHHLTEHDTLVILPPVGRLTHESRLPSLGDNRFRITPIIKHPQVETSLSDCLGLRMDHSSTR